MTSVTRLVPAERLAGLEVTLIRRMLAEAPAGALNLGIGQTDADVPDCIRAAVVGARALRRAPYELNAGDPELRARIGQRYGVGPERVLVTCGTQEALALALLGTVNPGDEVVVPDPGFPVYATLTRIAGGVAVPYRLRAEDRFRASWAAIEPHLGARTRMVVLASPGNPTGATSTCAQWRGIGESLAAAGIPYLSDEIYLDLQHGDEPHPSLASLHADGFVVSGLSKTHGLAGWRLGWLVVPATLFDPLAALHQQLVTSAATLVQEAALAAFSDEGEAFVRSQAASLRTRRARAIAAAEAAGLEVMAGDGAFYLFVRAPGGADALGVARRLLHECHVVTIPGTAFGAGGEGFLRLSYSAPEPTFAEAMARIGRWIESGGEWRYRPDAVE